jgi:hypothetical protein
MLETYFVAPKTLERLRTGLSGIVSQEVV